jgi:hypothetical protein
MTSPGRKRSRHVGVEGYLTRTLGSLPANLGIGVVQALTEAMADTARVGAEIVKAPGRYKKGKTEDAVSEPLEAVVDGVVNALMNVVRPLKRSHQMGVEDEEMMDPGQAVHVSLGQVGERFRLLGEALTPEQKKELVGRVKSKVAEVAPEEADKAARHVSRAMGGTQKKS